MTKATELNWSYPNNERCIYGYEIAPKLIDVRRNRDIVRGQLSILKRSQNGPIITSTIVWLIFLN